MDIDRIDMLPCYVWDCPSCYAENFYRGSVLDELSEEEEKELREDLGVQPWELGNFVIMPFEVQCTACGATYKTHRFGDESCDSSN